MAQQKVVWLDILADPPQEYSRVFPSWPEAEKFVKKLIRKHPIPVLVSELKDEE